MLLKLSEFLANRYQLEEWHHNCDPMKMTRGRSWHGINILHHSISLSTSTNPVEKVRSSNLAGQLVAPPSSLSSRCARPADDLYTWAYLLPSWACRQNICCSKFMDVLCTYIPLSNQRERKPVLDQEPARPTTYSWNQPGGYASGAQFSRNWVVQHPSQPKPISR